MTMSVSQSVHDLTTWAKAGLDELDAVISTMEARMATTSEEARLQAHLALLDARKWRESFRARARDLRRTVDSGAALAKADLDYAWKEFELAFGRWIGATGEHVEELQARTEAQLNGWARLVTQYRAKLEANADTVASSAKDAMRDLETVAAQQRAHMEKLQAAGTRSFGAWVEAIRESRAAFAEAVRATRTHFTDTE
jgi:hypothetical protein